MGAIKETGFSIILDPGQALIDIVFVHGLQGHPEQTWSYIQERKAEPTVTQQPSESAAKAHGFLRRLRKKSEQSSEAVPSETQKSVFWPRDLLAKEPDAQQTRILTYGYDSHVTRFLKANNQDNISKQSKNFLVALQQIRKTYEKRPLIFVAHSLGGILVKGVLQESKLSLQSQFSHIYNSTRAILFLGTPHGGSSAAEWGLTMTKVLRYTAQGSNNRVLDGLKPDSEILEVYSDNFLKMLEDRGFTFHSFYEKHGVSGIHGFQGKVVDDKASTVGHARAETVVGIDADHRGITKFRDSEDTGYQLVWGAIQDYILAILANETGTREEVITEEIRQKAKVCAQSLQLHSQAFRRETVPHPYTETAEWILGHQEFQVWESAPKSCILLLSGQPGCGKSVLTKRIYRHLLNSSQARQHVGACFFDRQDRDLGRSLAGMIRALLSDMLWQRPALIRHVPVEDYHSRLEEPNSTSVNWPEATLRYLLQFLADIQAEFFLIIDALDEAREEESIQIFQLLEGLASTSENKAVFKIFLSGRPQEFHDDNLHPRIRLESRNSPLRGDIETYIGAEVKRHWSDREESAILISRLQKRSNGIFLWVKLVLDILIIDQKRGKPFEEQLNRLGDIPTKMAELYSSILQQVESPQEKQVRKVLLQWIMCVERPLSIQELYTAFRLHSCPGKPHSEGLLSNTTNIERFRRQVGTCCGGLVEFFSSNSGTAVHLIHQSAWDFLAANPVEWACDFKPLEDWWLISHFELTSVCLEYISMCDLESGPITGSRLSGAYRARLKNHTFLQYAARYWTSHANQTSKLAPGLWHSISRLTKAEALAAASYQVSKFDRKQPFYPGTQLLHITSELGHAVVVQLLLTKNTCPTPKDCKSQEPLLFAAKEGHLDIVQMLCQSGSTINPEGGYWCGPLGVSASNGHTTVVQYLLEVGASINQLDGLLREVASRGHLEVLKMLIAQGAPINENDPLIHGTPLHAACTAGHLEVARSILEAGANSNLRGGLYGTALQAASAKGHEDLVGLLLAHGAELNTEIGQYGCPLIAACSAGHCHVVNMLLNAGAEVNLQDAMHGDALQAALVGGHSEIVLQLLARGAMINYTSPRGRYGYPLQAAMVAGNMDTFKILLKRGADVNLAGGYYGSALQAACTESEEEAVKLLLAHGADVFYTGGRRGSVLHAACAQGKFGICKLIIDAGADPHLLIEDNGTALHVACYYGHGDVVDLLLEHGVDINEKAGKHGYPVRAAAARGHCSVVEKLVKSSDLLGIHLEGLDDALDVAKRREYEDVVLLLKSLNRSTSHVPV